MCLKKKKKPQPQPESAVAVPELRLPAGFAAADADALNGLALAYIGDAVYELAARGYILSRYGGNVQALHEKTVAFSNAAFQAYAAEQLLPELSEAETAAYKRGRNAHPGHVPKNKTQAQYHAATGLEALFGWLYLQHDEARINALFRKIVSCSGGFENEKGKTTQRKESKERKEV